MIESPERAIPVSETRDTPAQAASVIDQLGTLIHGHLQLVALEGGFELAQAVKRVAIFMVCAFLGVTAYVLLQVGIVHGLVRLGLPLWAACFTVVAAYGIIIAILYSKVGRRDAKAGRPFQATRDEWKRSAAWIRKRFF